MANRSEAMKKAWRKRKREGGKAKCAFCGKPIFARGVRMKGKPYHKGCAEAKGAGLKPAQVGKNPGTNWHVDRSTDLLVQRTAAIKRGDKEGAVKLRAKIGENIHAAEASRRRGMNPPLSITSENFLDYGYRVGWSEAVKHHAETYAQKGYKTKRQVLEGLLRELGEDYINVPESVFVDVRTAVAKYLKLSKIPSRKPYYWNPRRKIAERKRAPRDAFRYFGAEELNPKFRFGPTGFRPPAKWFSKMAQGTSASHFGRKLKELTASQRAKVGQIVGGIWAKYTDATRFEILRKYEPAAVRALANPSLGKRVQMLNCPACRGLNPVSRLNVYLRCSTCGAQLRSVRVRHKH